MQHFEKNIIIPATPEMIFQNVDDHSRFSSHMNKSSWMMGGGKMDVSVDVGHGQKVGSHIRLSGKAFGIKLYLDEVITHYEPPFTKTWETVGIPKLLIIGSYRMSISIKPQNNQSLLNISIDYDLPKTNVWFGRLFSGIYARWCVKQMISGVHDYFTLKNK